MKAIYGRLAAVVLLVFGLGQAASAVSVSFLNPDSPGDPLVVSGSGFGEALIVIDDFQIPTLDDGLLLQLNFDGTESAGPITELTSISPESNDWVDLAGTRWFDIVGDSVFIQLLSYSSDPGPFSNAPLGVVSFKFAVSEPSFLTFETELDIAPTIFSAAPQVTAVPLPAAAWLLGSGLFALSFYRRRR